jgi:hypothetical protein
MFKPIPTFLLLAFSAFPTLAQSQADSARTAAGCGPGLAMFDVKVDKKQHPVPAPSEGKALLFFVQQFHTNANIKIGGITSKVGIDGKWVGANHGDSYFFIEVDPGEHRVCSGVQATLGPLTKLGSAFTLTAESGKSYFIRTRIVSDVPATQGGTAPSPEFHFAIIDSAEAAFSISTAGLSKSHQKNVVAGSN